MRVHWGCIALVVCAYLDPLEMSECVWNNVTVQMCECRTAVCGEPGIYSVQMFAQGRTNSALLGSEGQESLAQIGSL